VCSGWWPPRQRKPWGAPAAARPAFPRPARRPRHRLTANPYAGIGPVCPRWRSPPTWGRAHAQLPSCPNLPPSSAIISRWRWGSTCARRSPLRGARKPKVRIGLVKQARRDTRLGQITQARRAGDQPGTRRGGGPATRCSSCSTARTARLSAFDIEDELARRPTAPSRAARVVYSDPRPAREPRPSCSAWRPVRAPCSTSPCAASTSTTIHLVCDSLRQSSSRSPTRSSRRRSASSAAASNFEVSDHEVVLHGACDACVKVAPRPASHPHPHPPLPASGGMKAIAVSTLTALSAPARAEPRPKPPRRESSPATFVRVVDNPWFPLKTGSRLALQRA